MLSHKKASNTRIDHQKSSDDPSAGGIAPGQILAQVKVFAQRCFDNASGSHDWDHTLRVFRLCEMLGPAENADMVVLGVAAYLHDIGRALQDASNGAVCHAEKGAQMAEPMVEALPLSKSKSTMSFIAYVPIAFAMTTNRLQSKQRYCLMLTNWMRSVP
jgi:uncharacterized protein